MCIDKNTFETHLFFGKAGRASTGRFIGHHLLLLLTLMLALGLGLVSSLTYPSCSNRFHERTHPGVIKQSMLIRVAVLGLAY